MSNYNLSDNVDEDFKFDIRGLKYVMRYPRTEEVEVIQEMTVQLQESQDNSDKEAVEKLSKELESYLYGFITPVEHNTKVKDALNKENVRVMRNFNTMIKTELSIQ